MQINLVSNLPVHLTSENILSKIVLCVCKNRTTWPNPYSTLKQTPFIASSSLRIAVVDWVWWFVNNQFKESPTQPQPRRRWLLVRYEYEIRMRKLCQPTIVHMVIQENELDCFALNPSARKWNNRNSDRISLGKQQTTQSRRNRWLSKTAGKTWIYIPSHLTPQSDSAGVDTWDYSPVDTLIMAGGRRGQTNTTSCVITRK